MKRVFAASFLAFIIASAPATALAASVQSTGDGRYFVPTTNVFWRNAFHARNAFPDGFTANLSSLQLRIAKFAGLKPVLVKSFDILSDEEASASVEPSATPTPQPTPSQPASWGVQYVTGLALKAGGGADVIVAVLDTGIDAEHPDLKSRIAGCADYADQLEAFIDEECADENGHGTHMAGIIAGDGGELGTGIRGFAPEATLLAYKVCSAEGLCLSDDIAVGIQDATDAGANVIVLGFGGEDDSSLIDTALDYASEHDVLVIAAAGNNGPYEDSMDWPARNPKVVSVGALANDGTVANFSSRGAVTFVAPGVNIESTFKDDNYAILSGTSMAAAAVAGVAADHWEKDTKHPAAATLETARKLLPISLP